MIDNVSLLLALAEQEEEQERLPDSRQLVKSIRRRLPARYLMPVLAAEELAKLSAGVRFPYHRHVPVTGLLRKKVRLTLRERTILLEKVRYSEEFGVHPDRVGIVTWWEVY